MDAIIVSIGRAFNINEFWLRMGTGEMYKDVDTAFAEYIRELLN